MTLKFVASLVWLAGWLVRLADRLAPPAPVTVNPLLVRIKQLVAEAAALDAGGEYKKWQYVAAKLQKEFPDEKKRDLNYLIELQVQANARTR